MENEKIKFWREYQWTGDMSRDDFLKTEEKPFKFTIKELLK